MRVLYLGPPRPAFEAFLRALGDDVFPYDGKLSLTPVVDWVVSYGYRHRIPKAFLDQHPGRVINLHIGALPWNRGADPNLWSFLADTPKGVTIHYVDEGLDTGPILAQRGIAVDLVNDTLRTTYDRLTATLEQLFREVWPCLRRGERLKLGSYHASGEKDLFAYLWKDHGWDTPVRDLMGKAVFSGSLPTKE